MSALLKLMTATAAVVTFATPSIAGDPADFYANCCVIGSVRFRDLSKEPQSSPSIMVGASNPTVYESRTVIRSNYGTTVIRGISRYSR